ncbi:hypothetical protein CRENBAI_006016 [Crenichthys baileyi]|uniref:Uncharacterized protein n=1 Tax=Crenichthys baileyi TaxID=28760 RepID=A0AAV9QQV4_9TELE
MAESCESAPPGRLPQHLLVGCAKQAKRRRQTLNIPADNQTHHPPISDCFSTRCTSFDGGTPTAC